MQFSLPVPASPGSYWPPQDHCCLWAPHGRRKGGGTYAGESVFGVDRIGLLTDIARTKVPDLLSQAEPNKR